MSIAATGAAAGTGVEGAATTLSSEYATDFLACPTTKAGARVRKIIEIAPMDFTRRITHPPLFPGQFQLLSGLSVGHTPTNGSPNRIRTVTSVVWLRAKWSKKHTAEFGMEDISAQEEQSYILIKHTERKVADFDAT